jgi:predicted nucleic-acid-binding Zn-ribbon protein
MKKTGICPKCGSHEIVADAKAIDRGHLNGEHEMSVATFRKPEALFFKEKQETKVSAWVCAACGYVEFYADSPSTIKLPIS